jgi:hypothetical protein
VKVLRLVMTLSPAIIRDPNVMEMPSPTVLCVDWMVPEELMVDWLITIPRVLVPTVMPPLISRLPPPILIACWFAAVFPVEVTVPHRIVAPLMSTIPLPVVDVLAVRVAEFCATLSRPAFCTRMLSPLLVLAVIESVERKMESSTTMPAFPDELLASNVPEQIRSERTVRLMLMPALGVAVDKLAVRLGDRIVALVIEMPPPTVDPFAVSPVAAMISLPDAITMLVALLRLAAMFELKDSIREPSAMLIPLPPALLFAVIPDAYNTEPSVITIFVPVLLDATRALLLRNTDCVMLIPFAGLVLAVTPPGVLSSDKFMTIPLLAGPAVLAVRLAFSCIFDIVSVMQLPVALVLKSDGLADELSIVDSVAVKLTALFPVTTNTPVIRMLEFDIPMPLPTTAPVAVIAPFPMKDDPALMSRLLLPVLPVDDVLPLTTAVD